MPVSTVRYQELSLEQQVQRVRDAWFAKSSAPGLDPGWPLYVYPGKIIIEYPDGLYSTNYGVDEEGMISFDDPVKVFQEFIPARHPGESAASPTDDRRGLPGVAQDFVRATARLLGFQEGSEKSAVERGAEMKAAGDEGCLLEVPFRIYREEERYVGGLVLTPGDDNAFGDIWEADDIRLMAYRYMEQSRHIDYMHTTKVVAAPVESYYFPTAQEGGQDEYTVYGETVPGGSWWLGSRVLDDEVWEDVKSGKLKGYSMFAVKLTRADSQANRAYAEQDGQAPGGRKMNAEEWDITMVSLVDKPAVNKATYVIMRRAPDGAAVITRPEERQFSREGGGAMRNIQRAIAYIEENPPEPQTPAAGQPNESPPADGAETPPVNEQEQPSNGGQPNGKTGQTPVENPEGSSGTAGLSEQLAAGIMAVIEEKMTSILVDQIRPLVEASIEPLKQSVAALETRQARFSGSGALPVGRTSTPAETEEAEAQVSWTNFGSRPRRIESGANGHRT